MIPAEFHLIRPYWLLALLPCLVIVLLILRSKLKRGAWSAVCDAELLPYLLQEKAAKPSRAYFGIGSLAAFLAIVALAGPSWERLPAPAFRNSSALVILLDLSRSMDAEDIKPSRLVRARYKIADILRQRKDGQTALLVYAGESFTVVPLTDDTETIVNQLPALTTDIMPSPGSNTAPALQNAVALFKQAGQQQGEIILLTDGVDIDTLSGTDVLAVAESLADFRLSILGVGTADGAPIPQADGGFMKDDQGAIVVPKLNAADLTKLAQTGHGIYQTITANDTDIQALMTQINQPLQQHTDNLNSRQQTNLLLDQWLDTGPWLCLLILPLAALVFRKGLLCLALLLILPLPKNSYALTWQDLWQTKNQQAQQAYNNKQYEQAAKLFDNTDWKAAAQYKAGNYAEALKHQPSQSSNGYYNQGNALAQSGQLEQAIKAYENALAINPDNTDAQTNKELVEKELEKQQEKQKKDDQQNAGNHAKQDQKNKPSESSDRDDPHDEKPEQKPERPGKEQKSAEHEAEKQKPSQQQKNQQEEKTRPQQSAQQDPVEKLSVEKQQANEQWLKRIPDDPAGLLKRKFLYQYGRRNHQSNSNTQNW